MLQMSRKCVPYTPITSDLSELNVAIVSSTGIYLADQHQPFNDNGDDSYRVLPAEFDASQIRFKHGHYDTSEAEKDVNVVFPIDRLREFAVNGVIRGLSNKHISFKGFSMDLKRQYEILAPAIADELERSQADAVVLTGG